MSPDLMIAQKKLYEPHDLAFHNLVFDQESQEYAACTFMLNDKKIIFRVANITPKKIGQFVTIWKRNGSGPIMPYDVSDEFDFFVIAIADGSYRGQFIFPKSVLRAHDVISLNGAGGKRGMRVYPPWDSVDNPQAKKTQAWQVPYFVPSAPIRDCSFLHTIFTIPSNACSYNLNQEKN